MYDRHGQEGSMCRDLHGIALRINQFCLEQEIEFGRSRDDWQITRECLNALEKLWGRHTFLRIITMQKFPSLS